jgi:hypothetical protein
VRLPHTAASGDCYAATIQVPEPDADDTDVSASTFTRGPERLCCENHQERSGFALVLSTPGGGSITQRFTDAVTMSRRRLALEHMLISSGWAVEQVAAYVVRRR